MSATIDAIVRGGHMDPAGLCVVCGKNVAAGEGFALRCGDRQIRFKCARCLGRFEADPGPYLVADRTVSHETDAEDSPASEWACW